MSTINTSQYEAMLEIVNRAKMDDRSLDDAEYGDEILAALGVELVTTPQELTLQVTTSRPATGQEVSDLLYGTGGLRFEWWGGVRAEERDGVAGYLFAHATDDSPDDGSTPGRTWVSEQQILNAAALYLKEYHGGEDADDMRRESIGYADAAAADTILQYAVLGEAIFG